jgi:hypothetical protein
MPLLYPGWTASSIHDRRLISIFASPINLGYHSFDKTACRFSLPANRRLLVDGLPERLAGGVFLSVLQKQRDEFAPESYSVSPLSSV